MVTEAYHTAATYTGPECKYDYFFGSDLSYTVGGGTDTTIIRRSTNGLDIVPVVNQFDLQARFQRYFIPVIPVPGNTTFDTTLNTTSTSVAVERVGDAVQQSNTTVRKQVLAGGHSNVIQKSSGHVGG
jgi:hypothetical protein